MSRLIDADDFRRILREIQTDAEHFDNEQRRNDIGSIMALLDKQPTAFDTEKVVKQLEKLKQHNKKLSEGAYLEDDKSFYFCAYTNFAKAIDIVKKGGVE